jgi:hypothetical protein
MLVSASGDQHQANTAPGLDPRMHSAVTDLLAYVLVLDAERQRLHAYASDVTELRDRVELERRTGEIANELEAMREIVAALRAHRTAAGNQ